MCSLLISHYMTSVHWSSVFKVYIYIPVCHLKCCQKDQLDCNDFTSRCPTAINWLITQQWKPLVGAYFCVQLERAEAHRSAGCRAFGQGIRRWKTALKATNLCVALLRNKPQIEANCGWEWGHRNPSTSWRKSKFTTIVILMYSLLSVCHLLLNAL